DGGVGGCHRLQLAGGEAEFDGEAEDVDQLAVLGPEHVSTDDRVVAGVDEDLGGGGRLTDPVVGVPAAGVVVADIDVDAGCCCFVFEEPDADEFGDGEHSRGHAGVVRGRGGSLEHVGGGDL